MEVELAGYGQRHDFTKLCDYYILAPHHTSMHLCVCVFFFFIQLKSSTDHGLGSPAQSLMLSLV